ncbi:MAG: peptidase M48, partial [Hylemonella sp.]|nr:peptidase M48 [Hylemonella sp.]
DQGKQIPAIRAEAEAHASRLDYVAAYDRFQAAQEELGRRKNVDYVEASIVETRKRELESLIREQALER